MRLHIHPRLTSSVPMRILGLLSLIACLPAPTAMAGNGEPGSLILYPQFDNRPGRVTMLSLTNTSETDSVNAQFRYIGRDSLGSDCNEFNRVEALTPNDTFTTLVSFHNPSQEEGFVFVVAEDPGGSNEPTVFNYLLGVTTIFDGLSQHSYTLESFTYLALAGDLNGNGMRDLDGIEYEESAAEFLIPRFLGETKQQKSELILINLTYTMRASATVDMLVYNDNEEVFSSEYTFSCWERTALTNISGLFNNQFLQDFTNQDPNEVVGAPLQESGWLRLEGSVASTSMVDIVDPAVLVVLVETTDNSGTQASLPFHVGQNANGSLIEFGKF